MKRNCYESIFFTKVLDLENDHSKERCKLQAMLAKEQPKTCPRYCLVMPTSIKSSTATTHIILSNATAYELSHMQWHC